jgi:hypothetical protein
MCEFNEDLGVNDQFMNANKYICIYVSVFSEDTMYHIIYREITIFLGSPIFTFLIKKHPLVSRNLRGNLRDHTNCLLTIS